MTRILAPERLTVTRRTATLDQSTGLLTVAATGAPIKIRRASVQPAPDEVIQLLPEGARAAAKLVAYLPASEPPLRAVGIGGGTAPDLVTRDRTGKRYEVHEVADWTSHTRGMPHRAYALVEIADDEEQ